MEKSCSLCSYVWKKFNVIGTVGRWNRREKPEVIIASNDKECNENE